MNKILSTFCNVMYKILRADFLIILSLKLSLFMCIKFLHLCDNFLLIITVVNKYVYLWKIYMKMLCI